MSTLEFLSNSKGIQADTIIIAATNMRNNQFLSARDWRQHLSKISSDHVIFLSSASVYGLSRETLPFKESASLCPKSKYAIEKANLEDEVRKLNCDTTILRLSGFYNDLSNSHDEINFINKIKQHIVNPISEILIENGGQQFRDFTRLSSVFDFILKAEIDINNRNRTLNFSTTVPITINEIIQSLPRLDNIITLKRRKQKIHNSLDTSLLSQLWNGKLNEDTLDYLK